MPATKTRPSAASMSSTGASSRCEAARITFSLSSSRRQRRGAAGQHRAAAGIAAGAVRDDGAVALQDPDVFDPGAEFVGNHLRERRLEPLAVRGNPEAAGHRPGRIEADRRRFGAGVDRHARCGRDPRPDARSVRRRWRCRSRRAGPRRVPSPAPRAARRSRLPRRRSSRLSMKPDRSQTMPEATR